MPKARLSPEQRKANERAYSLAYNSKEENKERQRVWSQSETGKASRAASQERYRAKKQGRESKAPPKKTPQTKEERRESIRIASLKFTEENRELVNSRKRKWREENWDIQYALQKAWIAANPERHKELCLRAIHKRRVRLENQPTVDIIVWRETLEMFDYKCAYCRDWATCLDHVVPVSKGGTNDPDNCLPACKRCNSSKRDKDLNVWLKTSRIAKEALSRPLDYEPPEKQPKIRIPRKAA